MLRLRDDGLLLAGGTLRRGVLALLATDDPDIARICIAADPAVSSRLFRASIEPLMPYREAAATSRTPCDTHGPP